MIGTARTRLLRPQSALAALLIVTLFAFLARLPKPRPEYSLISADAVGYYSYLRSIVIDHDLDFADEFAYYHQPASFRAITATGRQGNKYAIGAAILWAPFFLAAHAVVVIANGLGLPVVPDGYGYLYESAACVGSIVYGWLGFVMAYVCVRRTFSRAAALGSIILLWFASNAFYYLLFEPAMAHMVALFAVSLTLTVWLRWFWRAPTPTLRHALVLGLASGLVLLVRLQDAPLLLLPYSYATIRAWQVERQGLHEHARRWLFCTMVAGGVAALCFVPQLVVWQRLYGTWTSSPYMSEHNPPFYWITPHIGSVLFSPFHGLFTWHPIFLLAAAGLPLLARRDHPFALGLIAVLMIETYVIASWWNWWQGAAFGGRMFLSAMWIWVWGLAALLEWLRHHRRLIIPAGALALMLIVWNGLAMVQYRLLLVPPEQPLTWHQITIDRLLLGVRLARRFLTHL